MLSTPASFVVVSCRGLGRTTKRPAMSLLEFATLVQLTPIRQDEKDCGGEGKPQMAVAAKGGCF